MHALNLPQGHCGLKEGGREDSSPLCPLTPLACPRCSGTPRTGSLWACRCAELDTQAPLVLSEGSYLLLGPGSSRGRNVKWPSPYRAKEGPKGQPRSGAHLGCSAGWTSLSALPLSVAPVTPSSLWLPSTQTWPCHPACVNLTPTLVLPRMGQLSPSVAAVVQNLSWCPLHSTEGMENSKVFKD